MTETPRPPAPPRTHPPLEPAQVHRRLADAAGWAQLGLFPDDEAEARAWAGRLTTRDLESIAAASARVLSLLGAPLGPAAQTFFDFLPDRPGEPPGLIPMLTLAACAPEVVAFGVDQGFDRQAAASGLADLGHQVHVHRLATGSFGLFTQWWLTLAWGGSLWWLGRLQYSLSEFRGRHWLSVHIPQTGPLLGVEESFTCARAFARDHLAAFNIAGLHLDSWLLDPTLVEGLGPESNTAKFAQRWQLLPNPREANDDAVFFTFGRRGAVDPRTLPRRTRLERLVTHHLENGGTWHSPTGLIRW